MDLATARWLTSPEAGGALAAAGVEADPGSVGAATRLRRRWTPEQAAAVLAQAALRRRAALKFGAAAQGLFFTADGLEQATRPAVAAWRARRLAATGATAVVDLGCGLGTDALAFADAGLGVVAVERDPVTATLAAANLAGRAEVQLGDAQDRWPGLAHPGVAVFCDPARRTARGRSWRVEDLTPSWDFVRGLLDGSRPGVVKLGPGVPLSLIPDDVAAVWVSADGDLVEAGLWAGAGWSAGERSAVLLPGEQVLIAPPGRQLPEPWPDPLVPGVVLYEPDGAVIRSGAVPTLAAELSARPVAAHVAYLIGAEHRPTGFATGFEVLEVLDAGEKALRAWVRERGIGTLEIKKRGLELDPAVLRRRLKPAGPHAATLILTPTVRGTVALVVRRLG